VSLIFARFYRKSEEANILFGNTKIEIQQNSSTGSRVVLRGQTYDQADSYDKANIRFSQILLNYLTVYLLSLTSVIFNIKKVTLWV
jgi:hypothetical protein